MKNIKNKIKFIAAAAVLGASVTSCSLDMLPLNDVVLENFWTNKSDVESVVASCYVGMQENGYVSSLIVWGEDRSDNIAAGPDIPTALNNLMKGSLKTTNTYCDWSAMYNVINRCNTVLYYAPRVAEKDPNYTESDLMINIAECKAIRAISYLTLIKTFKDVPFTLEPTIDDDVDLRLGQTPFEVVLDSLILDIESCKDYAPRRYSEKIFNTAKITRVAMYALLADLYLWRASDYNLPKAQQNEYYRKCIECCDWVLEYKIQQYIANDIEDEDLTKTVDEKVWAAFGYPLLAEAGRAGSTSSYPAATNAIFCDGNSYESIFELTYHYASTRTVNEDVGFMYGGKNSDGNSVQYVKAHENLMTTPPKEAAFKNTVLFPVNTDFRSMISFHYTENGAFDIYKYACEDIECNYNGSGTLNSYTSLTQNSTREHSQMDINWIFYRMTEIMLMRAEAEIELAGNINPSAADGKDDTEDTEDEGGESASKPRKIGSPLINGSIAVRGSSLTSAVELFEDAFNLISAVYVRSNPASEKTSGAKPARANIKTFTDFETLLMYERQREFLFEGKRYFDLVRQARREGNTNKFARVLSPKFGDGGAAVSIKMLQMDFMYMPVLKKQMQVNPNLVQNSTYLDEEEIVNN